MRPGRHVSQCQQSDHLSPPRTLRGHHFRCEKGLEGIIQGRKTGKLTELVTSILLCVARQWCCLDYLHLSARSKVAWHAVASRFVPSHFPIFHVVSGFDISFHSICLKCFASIASPVNLGVKIAAAGTCKNEHTAATQLPMHHALGSFLL